MDGKKRSKRGSLSYCLAQGLSTSGIRRAGNNLGIALKARWPWLQRSVPNKPWANLSVQVSKEVAGLISVAVRTKVGSGANTLFWKDKWLDDQGIQEIAPLVFALVPKSD